VGRRDPEYAGRYRGDLWPKGGVTKTIASLLAWITLAGPALAADEQQSHRTESQGYESPVLSLLLLPVSVLIKMASVFGPENDKVPRDSRPADGSSK